MSQTKDKENHKPNINELLEYALNIIPHAPTFKEFAVAMMEFMNEVNSKFVITLYEILLDKSPINGVILNKEFKSNIDEYTLGRWYYERLKDKEQKMHENVKTQVNSITIEKIDELVKQNREYRQNKKFLEMINNISELNYLAPYNAMLVNLQKSGTKLAFSRKKWKEYGRCPKETATPLIALVQFGPTGVLYDYESTEIIKGCELMQMRENELVELWCNMTNRTGGKINHKKYSNLINNLSVYGISLNANTNATSTYIEHLKNSRPTDTDLSNIDVQYVYNIRQQRYETINILSKFNVDLDFNKSREEIFHSLCYSLGHIFCRHIFYNQLERRDLVCFEADFEAEVVAWIVCKRNGVANPAEKNLSTYWHNNHLPLYSFERIIKAVTEIEKMLASKMVAKDGLWYKHDEDFRDVINKNLALYKASQKTKQNSSR